jgi:hypothetical protein
MNYNLKIIDCFHVVSEELIIILASYNKLTKYNLCSLHLEMFQFKFIEAANTT